MHFTCASGSVSAIRQSSPPAAIGSIGSIGSIGPIGPIAGHGRDGEEQDLRRIGKNLV